MADQFLKRLTDLNKKILTIILTIIGLFCGLQLLSAQTALFSKPAKVATQYPVSSSDRQETASLRTNKRSAANSYQHRQHSLFPETVLTWAWLATFQSVDMKNNSSRLFTESEAISSQKKTNKDFPGRVPDVRERDLGSYSVKGSSPPSIFVSQPLPIPPGDWGSSPVKEPTPLIYYISGPDDDSLYSQPPLWIPDEEPGSISNPFLNGQDDPNHQIVPVPTSFLLLGSSLLSIIVLRKRGREAKKNDY